MEYGAMKLVQHDTFRAIYPNADSHGDGGKSDLIRRIIKNNLVQNG